MNKQKILELTGLNEDDFYDQYPDQESFCQDYPEACAQLNQPYDVISPIVSKYETPGGVMNKTPNEFAIKPMSPKQTMYNVGSIGTSYSIPIYPSDEMKHGGGIHINPANKGKFTAWAQAHGMGVQEAARHVMANKEDYSSTIVKRANFARNFGGKKKEYGGFVEGSMHELDDLEIQDLLNKGYKIKYV